MLIINWFEFEETKKVSDYGHFLYAIGHGGRFYFLIFIAKNPFGVALFGQ